MKVSISLVNGSGYLNHNERKFTRGNIDRERTKNNIYLEKKTLEDAYKEYFESAVDEYNKTQKRSDRKKSVEGYLQELENKKHKKNAEKPFYELIIQVGDKDTCGFESNPQNAEKAKEVLLKYYESWKERNPNLRAFHVSLHMDEATPHMHIDYIPVATGYKQGLKVRNSLSKALENQGLGVHKGQHDNGAVRWQEREREYLSKLAKEHGFEVEVKGVDRPHLSVAEYKALMDRPLTENKTIKKLEGKSKLFGYVPVSYGDIDEVKHFFIDYALRKEWLESRENEYRKEQRKLDRECERLRSKELNLDMELKKVEKERAILQSKLNDDSLKNNEELLRKTKDLEMQLETMQRNLNLVMEQKIELEKQKQEQKEEIAKLKKEFESKERELETQYYKQNQEHKEEIANLKKEFKLKESELETQHQKQNQEQKEEIAKLKKEVELKESELEVKTKKSYKLGYEKAVKDAELKRKRELSRGRSGGMSL